ncbi:MAG: nucleoside triphosphate pyrophosphatase [Pseudomonadota bacterium]|nr:nucleoside triphosphate pyrophosphatase [Pseudomonadota bacterium]
MLRTVGPSKIVLASGSPRRKELLEQVGLSSVVVAASNIVEVPLKGERPKALVERLARLKAEAVAKTVNEKWVVAADTVVVAGNRILGKASTQVEARTFLQLLSGRRHQVLTGVVVIRPDGELSCRIVTTTITFKRIEREEIERYLSLGEWQGKAGAYAIQGYADSFVRQLRGSYSNVVGLPLYETLALLRGSGFVFPE